MNNYLDKIIKDFDYLVDKQCLKPEEALKVLEIAERRRANDISEKLYLDEADEECPDFENGFNAADEEDPPASKCLEVKVKAGRSCFISIPTKVIKKIVEVSGKALWSGITTKLWYDGCEPMLDLMLGAPDTHDLDPLDKNVHYYNPKSGYYQVYVGDVAAAGDIAKIIVWSDGSATIEGVPKN